MLHLWVGSDDYRPTTMACVYRDWRPTHRVLELRTARADYRLIWERGKLWTVWYEREGVR